jgi:flavin-binding protein dodecin
MAVARITTVIASSPTSWEDAANVALERASKTLRGITGMEVISQKTKIQDGKISEYRIEMKITFILEQ